MLNAVYITWNNGRIRGPRMFYEDELVFDQRDDGLVCRTDLRNKQPSWYYPNGKIVPSSSSPMGFEQRAYFYQYLSNRASRIMYDGRLYWGDTTNNPPGLYKCALRGYSQILTVGIYSSVSSRPECKLVN